jgi:precorrin-6A/cobalt-precorrin-6A reductase
MPTMDNQRRGAAVSRASESPNDMRRILILGGTTEARRLAERLVERADVAVTVSLAGRTAAPATHAVPVRIGGFGGAEGLGEYLTAERVDALIDATHPYAAIISANAADAAAATRVPLLALRRPPWVPRSGDRWIEVADAAAAVKALGEASRRVFLALGKREIRTFAQAPQHYYLVRSVEPVDPPLAVPHASYVTGRGPFTEANDRALLAAHAIDLVIARNSGGTATYGKIAAARALGLSVILLRRPALPAVPSVETVEDAVSWLDHALTLRGV